MQRCFPSIARRLLLAGPHHSPATLAASAGAARPFTYAAATAKLLFFSSPTFKGFGLPAPLSSKPAMVSLPMVQVRNFAAKERSRAPATPVKSKVKKYKLKSYSSFKFRFRTMNDGQIRRWRAGKRHNAHLKSKKSKRRLRKPEIVHAAYAKVLKKLNFCG